MNLLMKSFVMEQAKHTRLLFSFSTTTPQSRQLLDLRVVVLVLLVFQRPGSNNAEHNQACLSN